MKVFRFLTPTKLVAAGAAGLALALGGAGVAGALQPSPSSASSSASSGCDAFVNHLASDLGKSVAAVRSAMGAAAGQSLDDQVKAGKLTAAQAAKIKSRIGSNPCALAALRRSGGASRGAGIKMLLTAAAKTLNMTPADLRTQLKQGKMLSQLAGGMSEDQFRAALIQNLKAELDPLVQSGKLSSAREQQVLQRLQTAKIPYWSSPRARSGAAVPASEPTQ